MTAKPIAWVSWWDARCRMPEIWSGWSYDRSGADKAMVNALQSGEVHYRGEAQEAGGAWWPARSVNLKNVITGLVSLSVGFIETTAEYETTEWTAGVAFGRLPLQTAPRSITREKTAVIRRAEIAWEEFRDYLIRFELPAGAEPTKTQQCARAAVKPGRKRVQQSRGSRPFWREGNKEIDRWLEENGCPERGDGNQARLEKHIADWLQNGGHEAGEATIRRHVQDGIERHRAKVGA
jgi:hypothetical protein